MFRRLRERWYRKTFGDDLADEVVRVEQLYRELKGDRFDAIVVWIANLPDEHRPKALKFAELNIVSKASTEEAHRLSVELKILHLEAENLRNLQDSSSPSDRAWIQERLAELAAEERRFRPLAGQFQTKALIADIEAKRMRLQFTAQLDDLPPFPV